MRRIGAAVALAALGLSLSAGTAPANAFTCNAAPVNTGQQGVSGIVTVQVCSEGVRTFPTGEVTTVNQVGVKILSEEFCVGQGRVVVDLVPPFMPLEIDDGGLFGSPVYNTCP